MREKEFLDTLCNTGDGVFIVDSNKNIIRWNKGAERILKYPENEAVNQPCFRIISGKTAPDKPFCGQNCRIHSSVLKGTPQKNFDIISQTLEGELLWLNVTVISPGDSEEPFVAHIIRDVTREKRATHALDQLMSDMDRWIYEPPAAAKSPAAAGVRNNSPDRTPVALSSREIEVLTLLAEGLSTKGLAQRLNISHFTARNHIQNILVKLDLHSKAQAVSYAFKKGIL